MEGQQGPMTPSPRASHGVSHTRPETMKSLQQSSRPSFLPPTVAFQIPKAGWGWERVTVWGATDTQ